jgi:hypothetical protein
MRFEVLTAMKMPLLIFWIVTPYGLVDRYQHFRETYFLHLQASRWRQYVRYEVLTAAKISSYLSLVGACTFRTISHP